MLTNFSQFTPQGLMPPQMTYGMPGQPGPFGASPGFPGQPPQVGVPGPYQNPFAAGSHLPGALPGIGSPYLNWPTGNVATQQLAQQIVHILQQLGQQIAIQSGAIQQIGAVLYQLAHQLLEPQLQGQGLGGGAGLGGAPGSYFGGQPFGQSPFFGTPGFGAFGSQSQAWGPNRPQTIQ
jgi:hypothetical protein